MAIRIGLQIHAWVTINEDDHGWGCKANSPSSIRNSAGSSGMARAYRSQMSFAFHEVRKYKLAIINELLRQVRTRRPVSRLDSHRRRARQPADRCERRRRQRLRSAETSKRSKTNTASIRIHVPNDDERWVRLRAEPQTLFMRAVRERGPQAAETDADRRHGRPPVALSRHAKQDRRQPAQDCCWMLRPGRMRA